MIKTLNCGVIGVTAPTLDAVLAAARLGGFEGLEINPAEIAGLVEKDGVDAVKARFADAGVIPAAWGLPTQWRGSEDEYRQSLGDLPRLAHAAAAIGAKRVFTWILPASDERPFEENLNFHRERLTPIAEALDEAGCVFGLEFVGPKTAREKSKYPFIYELAPMLELGKSLGPNGGVMLDCWHWYTSGGTVADIERLEAKDVVYVHVNDAPLGVPVDSQLDGIRSVPGSTGVIDIAGFLGALRRIGYDGPITPEPFTSELSGLASDEERLAVVSAGLDKILALK